jgi:hypothetical protein
MGQVKNWMGRVSPAETRPAPEALDFTTEVVVDLVFSPEPGPDYRVYADEDLQATGEIHAIERGLEQASVLVCARV